jgi:hypothetical protein
MPNDEQVPSQPDPHHMFTALTTIIGRASLLTRQLEAQKPVEVETIIATFRLIEREGWIAFAAARVIFDQYEKQRDA